MTLAEYLKGQLKEACSAENRWYCSEYYGYEVTDEKILLEYYIKHGGTQHFASRHQKDLELAKA